MKKESLRTSFGHQVRVIRDGMQRGNPVEEGHGNKLRGTFKTPYAMRAALRDNLDDPADLEG